MRVVTNLRLVLVLSVLGAALSQPAAARDLHLPAVSFTHLGSTRELVFLMLTAFTGLEMTRFYFRRRR